MKKIEKAILSVSDKEGIVPLARALVEGGTEIISTGGTARLLRDNRISVSPIDEVTGFPEMLGGRVRTLHPNVFGGILGRRAVPSDINEMKEHGIGAISLVVVNFYPFEETLARRGATEEEIIESIDIGGPSLLRAAAKSFADVAVLHDPARYEDFLGRLRSEEGVNLTCRRELAASAFRYVARYDEAIRAWFDGAVGSSPGRFHLSGTVRQSLRYGENPHQKAAWYTGGRPAARYRCLQGKELSYNNLSDLDSAWRAVSELDKPAAVIVKHGNPCGAAEGTDLLAAYRAALRCDSLSAFGGIVAVTGEVEEDLAAEMKELFLEVVAAPSFSDPALAILAKKKRLRLVTVSVDPSAAAPPEIRVLADGFLVQEPDPPIPGPAAWKVASKRKPSKEEWEDALFAWKVVKHVRSNAIVLARERRTVGIGAGQMSRVDSTLLALEKAKRSGLSVRGAVLASDGFFPFPDAVEKAAEEGITLLVQPGGSIRDDEVLAEADRLGVAMIRTGTRHFRH